MTAPSHDQPRGAHSARAALADAAAPHPGGHDDHDDHGGGHGSGGDRSGWVLIPLLAGLVAAVALILVLGIGADAPEHTERLGPRAQVETDAAAMEEAEEGSAGESVDHGGATATTEHP